MATPNHKTPTMRAKITRAIRLTAGSLAVTVSTVAALSHASEWGWAFVVVVSLAMLGLIWVYADDASRRLLGDVDALLNAVNSFNHGVRSTRVRATGSREMRQLAEGFNRMASDAEGAFDELHQEEKRKMQFVSDVSHELRTPLTAIRGAAETLLEGDVPAEDADRFLSTIALESERLTRLANDLLTLQRIEGATGELPLRTFNLREAIDRASAGLEPLLEERGVGFFVRGEAPAILGDPDRIQQVITNLVDNASRMVGEGGRVWIDLGATTRAELGSHVPAKSFLDIDRFAVLVVSDDGPGIPEHDLPHLFERFYRTDNSRARNRGGAGLGLSIVRAIVVAHGGSIEAENRKGGGTQFTIYLPVPPDVPSTRGFQL